MITHLLIPTMHATRRAALVLICAALFIGTAACGGGGADEPRSERNLYGRTVAELNAAATAASSAQGSLTLVARAMSQALYVPEVRAPRTNPVTGQVEWTPLSGGRSVPAWYVAAWLQDANAARASGGWVARTLWVVRGSEYISTRDLQQQDAQEAFAVGTFPNPPFAGDGTLAVVELVRGTELMLVSAPIVWL